MPTVNDYLNALPSERKQALEAVRDVIAGNLPTGYEEVINWGMITYEVPLAIEPNTYNGKPLMFAALANQKNHMAVYLCSLNCLPNSLVAFVNAWKGKKLDMGKACVRFKRIADIDLPLIGKTIAATPVADFVAAYNQR